MNIFNIEIKSIIESLDKVKLLLERKEARFIGTDHQRDTYFRIDSGRLKLRQGDIENALIFYERPESQCLKASTVKLQWLPKENDQLRDILIQTHGIKVVVDKTRKIYFIDNVKFHLDQVDGVGSFVEIEACDKEGQFSEDHLRSQCEYYISYLGLSRKNFIDKSYSDIVYEANDKKSIKESHAEFEVLT